MDALEKQYQATEKEISDLKHELGEVMGANVHGKQGNQLLDDARWNVAQDDKMRAPQIGKPQFSASDVPMHVTGLNYPWELGYPAGPSPLEGPPPREEDMDKYEENVEESTAVGKAELSKWMNNVLDFFKGNKNESESLPGPQPQAPPSEFVWEESEEQPPKEEIDKSDLDSFKNALGGLVDFAMQNNTDDVSGYAKEVLDSITESGAMDKAGLFQTDPFSYGAVYVMPMDDAEVELEVLSQAALPQYGGEGTELQDYIDKVKQLFWPPFSNEITTVLGVIEGAIEDHYNPGQILQPGDTRLTVTSLKPIGNQEDTSESRYTIDYFFRGSELLYSKDKNTGEIMWGQKYNK